MKTKKNIFNLGGQAIASGGFGCVFLPPLKCKGVERPTGKVVSKLLTTLNAADEFNEAKDIQKMLQTNLSVDIYNRFFIFPEKLCEPYALTDDDLKNFEKKCTNLTKIGITANNINKKNKSGTNLDAVRIIELTNGGSDLKNVINQMKTINDLGKLNQSIIELLTNAVVPMNRLGILHFDLKSPNILVGDDHQLRLIDWGLSVISKNNKIPSGSTMRPIQYNLPFSTVLFNENIIKEINNGLKKIHFDVNYKEAIKPELSAIIHKVVIKHFSGSNRGHIGYVSENIKNLFNINGEKFFFIFNLLTNYLTEAVINFINPQTHRFDDTKYFNDVCMQNCDVWGLITVYNDIVNRANMLGIGRTMKMKQLRLLVVRYLYSPEFAGKPIDIDILVDELKSIFPFNDKIKTPPVSNNGLQPKENDSTTKKQQNKKSLSVSKTHKAAFVRAAKILRGSETSVNPSPVKKKTRRKRCKNGTRRNKKTGECEEINKVQAPISATEPVDEPSSNTGSLLESMGLISKPEQNIPVVKKQKVVIGEKKVINVEKNTRKRCKNGTRRNKKTGECENKNNTKETSINRDTSETTTNETDTPSPINENDTETTSSINENDTETTSSINENETDTPSPINETDTSNLLNNKQNPEKAEPPSLFTRLGF